MIVTDTERSVGFAAFDELGLKFNPLLMMHLRLCLYSLESFKDVLPDLESKHYKM